MMYAWVKGLNQMHMLVYAGLRWSIDNMRKHRNGDKGETVKPQ
jgi:hypothetical protein